MSLPIMVIDHGAGNMVSMVQSLRAAGATPHVVESPDDAIDAAGMVLPGVGATGAAMARLIERRLVDLIKDWDGPLLGVCVGMQLFFDYSAEDDTQCLGLMAGTVERLQNPRLPHMGWNDLELARADHLLAGLSYDETFYFVHSYAPVPADPQIVVATTDYGAPVTAFVRSGARVGVQFHPERSGQAGQKLMFNFVEHCRSEISVAS
jgi:glutamine amidotransferase